MTTAREHLLTKRIAGSLAIVLIAALATTIGVAPSHATAPSGGSFGVAESDGGKSNSSIEDAGKAVLAAGATAYAARLDDGRKTSVVALGAARHGTPGKVHAGDEFQMGSNTKTFVATVALQLVGEGKLDLDDTVEVWLPGIVPDGAAITVRMLLQHTSGLADYAADKGVGEAIFADPLRVWTPEELVAVAVAHEPDFAPGASWSYTNTGFVLMGMILQKVTGEHVRELVQRRIVAPLKLAHTYWADDSRFRNDRHLHGYYRTQPNGTEYVDVTDAPVFWADAAGAMVSNLEDLTRFARALQGGRLLEPDQLDLMRTTVDIPGQEGVAAYGLGLIRFTTPAGIVWGHTGGSIGYLSQVWASADGSRSFVQIVPTGAATPEGPDAAIDAAAFAGAAAGWGAMWRKP